MPPTVPTPPGAEPVKPQVALRQWAETERAHAGLSDLHWSDTTEEAVVVDLVPNPKRFLIGRFGSLKLAMDCGLPGVHIGK